MKKLVKWFGIALGVIAAGLLLVAAALYLRGNSIMNKTYTIEVDPVNVPADAASIERGRHLASVLCVDCHGADLGGIEAWFKGGPLGTIDASNLTTGEGGIGQTYLSVEDYVRAIRHGVDPQGKPIQMPAVTALTYLSDADLGAVIAYLKTLPPVNRVTRGTEKITPLAVILTGAGQFDMPAALVDHTNLHPSAPPAGVTAEYGKYLATINHCNECHGENLAGGRHPDPSVKVYGTNLTQGGEMVSWTEADFVKALRTGLTPSGHQIGQYMPWPAFGKMTDDELKAIWLYLKSLPAQTAEFK